MMNFIGKSSVGGAGSGGSSSSSSRRQNPPHTGDGGGGNSLEEEDKDERQNTGPAGQLFPSSSSSSPSSSHHHQQHQYQHQPSPFHPQHPYRHRVGNWMHGGESSSRITDPMMTDYSSVQVTPARDDNNSNNNNNIDGDGDQQSGGGMMMMVEREHMFDKVVTPSDVGKLNRLVIPKQHAERYFPLDSSTNDKGLLLNFEDRNGKPWRFRYSYWNSSQSYVMTKGWSRFVKDKKLDAGDIVSFQRGVGGSAKDRLFIDWRHRPDAPPPPYHLPSNLSFPLPHHQFSFRNNIHPWNPVFLQSQPAPSRSHSNLMLQPSSYRYGNTSGPYHNIGTGSVVNVNQGGSGSGSLVYFRSGGSGGIPQQHVDMMHINRRPGVGIGMDPPALPPPPPQQQQPPPSVVFESVPVVHGKAAAKRLRLFGVNMDCPISDDEDQEYDQFHNPLPSSSSTIPYQQLTPYEEETEFHQTTMMPSSSSDAYNNTTKSPSSDHMSLDFGI
ncbi:uncharacterized protein LOC143612861 [Bidens hawaiensis]|uniref:uncharacterized protein LOC143612861 n=1 Tax=Bidens hawaiensis TaxID=980011 RepID=UPI00404B7E48